MKVILLLLSLSFILQSLPANAKTASDKLVKEALANPGRYQFKDSGNIDFGNGFYKRRVDFAGRPQVCHYKNYLYAGTAKKCVK